MFLVSLLTLTAVSAAENATADVVSVDENASEELDIPTEDISKSSQTITALNDTINNNTESEISLNSDYAYVDSDSGLKNGIEIDRDLTINGNGHTIDGGGKARLFHVKSGNVLIRAIWKWSSEQYRKIQI